MTESGQQGRQKYATLVVLLSLLVAERVLQHYLSGFANDDCYITFRYARNIVEGNGFVFNLGEPILGTSTPLWTVLLAIAGFVFGSANIPLSSVVLSIVMDIGVVTLLWKLGSKSERTTWILAAVLYVGYPKSILIGSSGMESSLVAILMLGAFTLYLMDKGKTSASLLGLLLLTRADGAIYVAVMLGWMWIERKRFPLNELLTIAIVAAPWLVFSQLYFGSVVPHSIMAKSVSYEHLFPAFDPVRVLAGYLPFEALRTSSVLVRLPIIAAMLIPVFAGLVLLWRQKSRFALWPAFFIVYTLAFSFARVIMHDWYYIPGFLAYFITLSSLVYYLLSTMGMSRTTLKWWIKSLTVICFALYLIVISIRLGKNVGAPFEREYGDLARYFRDKSGSTILLEPIGFVGWLSGSYIYDPIGIVSLDVVSLRHSYAGSDQWWLDFVRASLPDYIVLRSEEVKENKLFLGQGEDLFSSESDKLWFKTNYREVNWPHRTAIHFSVFRKNESSKPDFAFYEEGVLH